MNKDDVCIIKNPEMVIEKRPGPNFFKTPLSEYKEWDTAQGKKLYGGTWYKNDFKASTAIVTENIFNNRLINKALYDIGKALGAHEIEFDEGNRLHILFKEALKDAMYYDSAQHINKIDINALYGAMGNEFFHLFKLENAIDITISGQHLIKYLANCFDNYFRNDFWKDKRFFDKEDPMNAVTDSIVKIIETDSVVAGTLVEYNGVKIPIEQFFDTTDSQWHVGDNYYGTWNDNKPTTTTVGLDSLKEETKEVNYVMSHKVKKEMFKITVGDKEVTITEDHGLMVLRDGKLIEVKPTEVKSGDELILE
jgi:hypothetical protein